MSSTIMRTAVRLGLLTGVMLSAAGIALAQDVAFNAMPGTDFTKFKTYKWVNIEGATAPDQITDQQIRSAVDSQLAAKGLSKAEGDQADLYVGYQVAVTQERQWNTYGMGHPGWYGGGVGTATSETINIGTLGLDFYDAANKQLVWRGSATKTIDAKATPEKRQNNINKAMEKLLKSYPPPEKK
jgi:hypothetical protein